ncbi:hypothetical protein C7212DRAFT_356971 [Tuber magnatum]|uniref:Uncharacterized protein n=1 Tax=Tuber magnatum TaxID=42249 RepID=A0A317SSR1_9PEZI|nr:hypothetical protein C7212DRAFT_356971 [Tuber magnatum]
MSNQDAEYLAFLEKSSKDYSKPSGGIGALKGRTYASDADEEFQPVSVEYEGDGLPSEEEFAQVLSPPRHSEIKAMDAGYWDVHNDYQDVRDAVVAAAGGDVSLVRVYRVSGRGARAEYYVLGLAKGKKVLEGVKVLAVES